MSTNIPKAFSEIDAILEQMDNKYISKIPSEMLKLFKESKDKEYHPKIEFSEKFLEQDIERQTIVILAFLYLNYWCDDLETKQNLLKQYLENDKKSEMEKIEKYNPNNVFTDRKKQKNNNIPTSPSLKNENIFYKIKNIFKNFFN